MAALPQLIDDGCIWHAHAYGACMHMARACMHTARACMCTSHSSSTTPSMYGCEATSTLLKMLISSSIVR